jgi:hypothetical protein
VYLTPILDWVTYYGIGLVLVVLTYLYVYSALAFLEKRKRQLFKDNGVAPKKLTLQLRRIGVKKTR